jgi:putative tricarboxylic transport membrane protein
VRGADRPIGLALALLGMAVFWSARSFPNVPGQDLGAGFLPTIVGVGLVLCAVVLMVRPAEASARGRVAGPAHAAGAPSRLGAPLLVLASIAAYVGLADLLGFLVVAPLCLLALFRAFGLRWGGAMLWALVGSAVVHVGFYKGLRVPLPWGVIPPFF